LTVIIFSFLVAFLVESVFFSFLTFLFSFINSHLGQKKEKTLSTKKKSKKTRFRARKKVRLRKKKKNRFRLRKKARNQDLDHGID